MQKFGTPTTKKATTVLFRLNRNCLQVAVKPKNLADSETGIGFKARFLIFYGKNYGGSLDAGSIGSCSSEVSRSFDLSVFLQSAAYEKENPTSFIMEIVVKDKNSNKCTTFTSKIFTVKSNVVIKVRGSKSTGRRKFLRQEIRKKKQFKVGYYIRHSLTEIPDLPLNN